MKTANADGSLTATSSGVLPLVPVSYFSVVVVVFGEALNIVAIAVWAALVVCYLQAASSRVPSPFVIGLGT